MKSMLKLRSLVQTLIAACAAVLLTLTAMAPTLAAPMRNEPNPSANAAAKQYEQAARDAIATDGPAPNLEESQRLTNNGGLNEVQGTAGAAEMKRPSNSGGVPTVEKEIKNALEQVQEKFE